MLHLLHSDQVCVHACYATWTVSTMQPRTTKRRHAGHFSGKPVDMSRMLRSHVMCWHMLPAPAVMYPYTDTHAVIELVGDRCKRQTPGQRALVWTI